MQKHRAHYPLREVKRLISSGRFAITRIAQRTAYQDFVLLEEGIMRSIMALTSNDFFKSMTSYQNHRIWQDVYKPMIGEKMGYIKLQIVEKETVVISFKEQ